MASAQDEAIVIIRGVIQDLASPNHDLLGIMRRCQHACEILGWQPAKTWFHQEINGYYPETPLPPHRKVSGVRKWESSGYFYESFQLKMTLKRFGLETDFFDEQPDVLDVKAGVNWFIAASRTGYREELQEAKEANIPSKNINATLQRVRIFTAGNISYSLSQIEKHVFDWASSSYVQLQYGNKVKDIWELYRSVVDNAVQQLGLTNHLSAIHDGIKTDNPESWRATVLECRNLLNDLANILWQDPKATYEHLLGSGVDGKLDVRQGNYSNRISAYLHQKSVTGTMGKFLRDEAERLSVSIRSLIAVESAAHEPIDKLLANTVILSTYFLIGELAQKTDLLPVTEYGPVN